MDAAWLEAVGSRRARNYFVLSRVFHERPARAFLEELGAVFAPTGEEGALTADAAALSRAALDAAGDAERVRALAVEFTRLFGGLSENDLPPPIESVIREGRLFGDSTAAVRAAYAAAGYPEPLPEAGPPDHVASELRFLALCCHEEATAWKRADASAAAAWLRRESGFLGDHVLAWVPRHCAAVAERTTSSLYAAVCRLVARACALDRDDVAAMLASVQHPIAGEDR